MANGFIKLHRKLVDWGWYADGPTKDVFLHLLLTANFRETQWRGIDLKPGQTVVGRKKLAQELGLSERQVRTALEHLKSTNEVSIKTTNKFTVVTIENWTKYQLLDDDTDQQIDQQPTSGKPMLEKADSSKNAKIDQQNDQQSDQQVYPSDRCKSEGLGDAGNGIDQQSDQLSDQQPTSNRPTTDQQPTTPEEGKEYKKDKKEKNVCVTRARANDQHGQLCPTGTDDTHTRSYGILENVELTDDQHAQLCATYEMVNDLIDKVSLWLPDHPRPNHYAICLKFARNDDWPKTPKKYTGPEKAPIVDDLSQEEKSDKIQEMRQRLLGMF